MCVGKEKENPASYHRVWCYRVIKPFHWLKVVGTSYLRVSHSLNA